MPGRNAQLIAELTSPDAAVRADAAEKLARLETAAHDAAVPLCRASDEKIDAVSDWAVTALEELGPPLDSDIDALARMAALPNVNSSYWAAMLLGRLGSQAAPAVPTLAAVLKAHPVLVVRQRTAWALGEIGPAAIAALAELKLAASSEDPRLARLARRAVEQVTGHPNP